MEETPRPRTLEEICGGNTYYTDLNGNSYCLLNMSPKLRVKCLYLSDYKDQNDLPVCLYHQCHAANYDLEITP